MTTQFVIRDDDLCFFSDFSELERHYGNIWDRFPVTFAAVPWQKGAFAGHIPLTYWHADSIFPLGENTELVQSLRKEMNSNHIDIALHGIHHTYVIQRNRIVPELKHFNGDFRSALLGGKEYLDNLFGTDIKIFVPPSNTMNAEIAKILIDEGWCLLNLPGIRANTRPIFSAKHQLGRLMRIKSFMVNGVDMSMPLIWGNRWEIGGFPLTPQTDMEKLKFAFRLAVEKNHPFVLATHYWEHDSFIPGSSNRRQYDLLMEFLDYVNGFDILPVRASDLIP